MPQPQGAPEVYRLGRSDGFVAVVSFLRSLKPSLEHLAVQFRAVGIGDAERLRVVATWRKRHRWLSDKLCVNAFEEEVLRLAFDEVKTGERNV